MNIEPKLNSSAFVEIMEGTYKPYTKNPGMAKLIETKLQHLSPDNLSILLKAVTENYTRGKFGPPDYIEIKEIADNNGIGIKEHSTTGTRWQCGQCGKIYDYDERICPSCGKGTNDLPNVCSCGTIFPDSFGCCTKETSGIKTEVRIYGVHLRGKGAKVICSECGREWNQFDLTRQPDIFSGRCKNSNCGKMRESGRVVRR